MLADGETEDVSLAGKLEAVATRISCAYFLHGRHAHSGVMRENCLLLELKVLEVGGLQYLASSYKW